MGKSMQHMKDDSGQVIMFVLFVVLFIVLFVSLFISNTLTKQSKIAIAAVNSVQAYYIADSGAENVLYNISQLPADTDLTPGNFVIEPLFASSEGESSATVVDSAATGSQDEIDIIGTYKKTSRAIKLFW